MICTEERNDLNQIMIQQNQQLREGKDIREHDMILLKHEHLEYGLMNKLGIPYDKAHDLAQSKYDYAAALNYFKKKNNLQKGSECVVKIEKMELTDQMVRYRYFPEKSKKSGIVALNRDTGERILEKALEEYGNTYAAHALRRIEEYQRNGKFPEKDVIVWY